MPNAKALSKILKAHLQQAQQGKPVTDAQRDQAEVQQYELNKLHRRYGKS